MLLTEIYEYLRNGELSQISLGENCVLANMGEQHYKRVGMAVTRGLTELHKRFLLKERYVVLELQEGQEKYVLSSAFAQSNEDSEEDPKYINDEVWPFTNNILKIARVFDTEEDECGKYPEYNLNLVDKKTSIRTPDYRTLIVPSAVEAQELKVIYHANHTILTATEWDDPENCTIELPDTHLEPLLLFIASKLTAPQGVGPGNAAFHEGNNYMAQFEAACAVLKGQNLEVDTEFLNLKALQKGFR